MKDSARDVTFRDDTEEQRSEALVDGETAGIDVYHRVPGQISLIHTEVIAGVDGRGLAPRLVRTVLEHAGAQGLAVLPFCPYVETFIARHPEGLGLVPPSRRDEFNL